MDVPLHTVCSERDLQQLMEKNQCELPIGWPAQGRQHGKAANCLFGFLIHSTHEQILPIWQKGWGAKIGKDPSDLLPLPGQSSEHPWRTTFPNVGQSRCFAGRRSLIQCLLSFPNKGRRGWGRSSSEILRNCCKSEETVLT